MYKTFTIFLNKQFFKLNYIVFLQIARQLLDDHVKLVNEEISNLKKDFSKAEKEKLEAETRLDVLSSYFKEKETTLQK